MLRTFSTSLEKEDQKPMPSFPDMVAYVHEKVRLGAAVHSPQDPDRLHIQACFIALSGGSEDQDSS